MGGDMGVRGGMGGARRGWRGGGGWCLEKGRECRSVLPPPLPPPPTLSGVYLLVCRSQRGTSRRERLGANSQERSGSGKGWAGDGDEVPGRTPVGAEQAAPPPRPYHCGRGPGQGLLGNRWAFGKEGTSRAGAREAAGSPRPEPLGLCRWGDPISKRQVSIGTRGRGFGPATKYADSTLPFLSPLN